MRELQVFDEVVADTSNDRIEEHCVFYGIVGIAVGLVLIDEIPSVDEVMFQILADKLLESEQRSVVNQETIHHMDIVTELADRKSTRLNSSH